MRPKQKIVPIPSSIGEGTIFEGRSFKIDQNALGAFHDVTGKALFTLISSMRKAEIQVRSIVREYMVRQESIKNGAPLTNEMERRMAQIESEISESTSFVNPQHCTVAIWAGLQHEWLKGTQKPLTVDQVGAELGPHITNDLLILLQESMLPPDEFPKKILESAEKNGAGEDPLTRTGTGDSGERGPLPEHASVSPTPISDN